MGRYVGPWDRYRITTFYKVALHLCEFDGFVVGQHLLRTDRSDTKEASNWIDDRFRLASYHSRYLVPSRAVPSDFE